MAIPNLIVKILYAKSGNRCAYPGCDEKLVYDEVNQSEMAHIISGQENGPRHIPGYNNGNYDIEENILVLCKKHHKKVDYQIEDFPIQKLREMKYAHENYIEGLLGALNDSNYFKNSFLQICQRYQIYNNIKQHDFSAPFPSQIVDNMEFCALDSKSLFNYENLMRVNRQLINDIREFVEILEDLSKWLSIISDYNLEDSNLSPKKEVIVKKEYKEYIEISRKKLIYVFDKYLFH